MKLLALTKAKSETGKDKDNVNGQSAIEIPQGEGLERHRHFCLTGIILLILAFCIFIQILVTLSVIYGEFNNETVTINGPQEEVKTTDHAAEFPTTNFQPAGKPDKEFWISLKPTVQIDRKKLNNRCRIENGRAYCRIPYHMKGAKDPRNCTIMTVMSDEINQNESASFELETQLLKNTTCDVVALRYMPLDVLPPILQINSRFTIINGESDEVKKGFLDDNDYEWFDVTEIRLVNETSIAVVESRFEFLTRMEELVFMFQLKRMVEGMAEQVVNIFEQVQSKGFRLATTNSSCSEVDTDDCVLEYSFVNANYLWEYISIPNNDKREEE
ncbi:unnamed protein product [Orchesella dallaii]|uniref:Uncharacterized protein n=1 Tax=Orchesella dallaii TaxID=48710 RepID=A0ABP1QIQ3_9HEXA